MQRGWCDHGSSTHHIHHHEGGQQSASGLSAGRPALGVKMLCPCAQAMQWTCWTTWKKIDKFQRDLKLLLLCLSCDSSFNHCYPVWVFIDKCCYVFRVKNILKNFNLHGFIIFNKFWIVILASTHTHTCKYFAVTLQYALTQPDFTPSFLYTLTLLRSEYIPQLKWNGSDV